MALSIVSVPQNTMTTGIAEGANTMFRVRDIDPKLAPLNTDDGTFYKMMDMIPPEEAATQPRYEWGEDDVPGMQMVSTKADGEDATVVDDIEFDSTAGLIKYSQIMNTRTGEIILCTAAMDSTVLTGTVTRGFRGTAAKAIVAGDVFVILPTTLPELAAANLGPAWIPSEHYNFIERVSEGFKISDLQTNCEMIDGVGLVPYQMVKTALYTKRKVNFALLWGRRNKVISPTAADGYIYSTNGMAHWIHTHELNLTGNGGLSWPVLNHFLNKVGNANNGSPTRTLVCGQALFSAITRISWDHYTEGGTATFMSSLGAVVSRIVTDQGLIVDVVLDKYGFPQGTSKSGCGFVLDMAKLRLKPMRGEESLVWRQNIQADTEHVRQDEIYGSFSLKLTNEECFGYISGATEQF